jgi:hypothetical protein
MATGYDGGLTLAELWNGMTWATEPPVSPANSTESPLSVSCVATSDCEAVGFVFFGNMPSTESLAEIWNGSAWLVQPTPAIKKSTGTYLLAVSCSSVTSCQATGVYTETAKPDLVLGERYSSGKWIPETTPNPG